MEKATWRAVGLDDLDAGAVAKLPLGAAKRRARAAVVRAAAEHADDEVDAVRDAARTKRDVVELRRERGAGPLAPVVATFGSGNVSVGSRQRGYSVGGHALI